MPIERQDAEYVQRLIMLGAMLWRTPPWTLRLAIRLGRVSMLDLMEAEIIAANMPGWEWSQQYLHREQYEERTRRAAARGRLQYYLGMLEQAAGGPELEEEKQNVRDALSALRDD